MPDNQTTTAVLPNGNLRLHGLDHLRALAITLVFLFHYQLPFFGHPEWLPGIAKFGWTGVDLFFVLSGYLIASQLFEGILSGGTVPLKAFFIKRSFRILPAYLVVVGIYFLFPWVHEREALAPLWKYLGFTQNLGLDLRSQGTFSHAWSLCIEEQFYLALPLLLLLLLRTNSLKKGVLVLAGLFALTVLLRPLIYLYILPESVEGEMPWGVSWYRHIYYPTYCRLDGLLTGVGIAALFAFKPLLKERLIKYGSLFLPAGLLTLAAAYYICLNEQSFEATTFGFPLVSMGYGFVLIGALNPPGFLSRWRFGAGRFLARLSFSIYLTHKLVVHITQELLWNYIDAESNTMLLLCTLSCLAGALLLNIIIEKPFMKLRNRLLA